MTTTRHLYDLQELDWEMDHSQAEVASIEAQFHDDKTLIKARSAMLKKEEGLHQLRNSHAYHSTEVSLFQEKVVALEGRLYGGSVRNPRELESLQSELRNTKEHAVQEEEELLNLMLKLDDNEQQVINSRIDLEKKEKAWAETQVRLINERSTKMELLNHLRANRELLVAALTSPVLTQYERLRKIRHGHAVAKVERGMCMGCRLTLPTKEVQLARTTQDIVMCNSCGRILFAS